jgi:hypothetical protein
MGAIREENVELAVGGIGAFEIVVDGETRYSKLKTKRFPTDAELEALL